MANWRLDAHGLSPEATAFAERELESVRSEVLLKEHEPMNADRYIPQNDEHASYKSFVVHQMKEYIGLAQPMSSAEDDFPLANVTITETQYDVRNYALGYKHDVDEIEAANDLNKPLDRDRAEAARMGTERRLNQVQWFGDVANGLPGAINNPSVPRIQLSDTIDSTTSADTIKDIINDLVNNSLVANRETGRLDTILMATGPWTYIFSTDKDPNSSNDTTIGEYIQQNNPQVETIDSVPELTEAGPNGEDLILAYSSSAPDVMEHLLVQEWTQLPPQDRNFSVVTPAKAKSGGVPYNYPLKAVVGVEPLS